MRREVPPLEAPFLGTGGARSLPDYLPIRDYAIIGDCHGCALVSRAGSVDWCAFERLDAPPVFCRLLDAKKGGFFSLAPRDAFEVQRAYVDGSNMLRTVFTSASAKVAVVDYMPVGRRPGSGAHDYVSLSAPGLLVRCIEGLAGKSHLEVAFRPSIDYARAPARLSADARGVFSEDGAVLYAGLRFALHGDLAHGALDVAAGERRYLVVAPRALPRPPERAELDQLFAVTDAFWSEWIDYCRYQGPYRDMVGRSALALKLLAYAPTGAIVAAPTTSLPEQIGGGRNWDYRYCWLRDSSLALYALAMLGYGGEAKRFGEFVKRMCHGQPSVIQTMYGIGAEAQLDERVLKHLEGYRGSRPVRVGNDAYRQLQIDVYGELVDWAYLRNALGGKLDGDDLQLLERVVGAAAARIDEPDHGIWEARTAPRHYVLSKMMAWVALDRGIRLLGERPQWLELRSRIEQEVARRGVDAAGGHLLQAYGEPGTDAALLLAPMIGFPLERPVFERTVAAIERELRRGDYLERYRTEDGLRGDEGAFLMCSFWLVDAYLALGRHQEATALFERLCRCANDVGLLSEEIDPRDHAFLGNFPQAFTHLALIASATHLQLFEQGGPRAIAGTYADRARRAVGATFGWRALWEACKASGRVGRFWSSRHSILR